MNILASFGVELTYKSPVVLNACPVKFNEFKNTKNTNKAKKTPIIFKNLELLFCCLLFFFMFIQPFLRIDLLLCGLVLLLLFYNLL